MLIPKIQVLADAEGVAVAGAERVVAAAQDAVAERGAFAIALAGGSTPKRLYELLAGGWYRDRIEWERVEVYFGDERCVGPEDPESNYRMVREALLDQVPIPAENVHRIRGEIEPEAAAIEYGQLLKARFGDEGGVDLTLLGMGDDGHTASLFPGTTALDETKHRAVANFVPKLNAWRVTMTAPFLNRSREVMVLVTGAGKAARVSEVLEGERDPKRLPIQLIQPASGRVTWIMDVGAAGM
jgi:6-phosphogluconolactonase